MFNYDGEQSVYLSSADLMTRNLNRRVEQLFPVLQPDLAKRVVDIYTTMWNDNVKTRTLDKDGVYKRVDRRGREPLDCQEYFAAQATKLSKAQQREARPKSDTHFQPMMSPQNQPDPLNDEDGRDKD